ncbi:uncharacterized protein LOC123519756 [Portunus trituberculatus]|uniref:uncharacterized protein LOC123519756 n=1 Tax=Portunus trituberculatus TaxID=210409 RepID=UPI001E1CD58E|nr:uncharacterized protein LOC123519756 [Portunus trituberculatus]
MTLLGIRRFMTASYHPQANRKASLAASSSCCKKWADALPLTLLTCPLALQCPGLRQQPEGVLGESSAGATSAKTFASQDLDSCSHIFLRVDGVRRPLQQPYHGPFKVLRCTRKTFILDINSDSQTVAVDKVKPAYLLQDVPDQAAVTTTSAVCTAATHLRLGRQKKRVSFLLPRH